MRSSCVVLVLAAMAVLPSARAADPKSAMAEPSTPMRDDRFALRLVETTSNDVQASRYAISDSVLAADAAVTPSAAPTARFALRIQRRDKGGTTCGGGDGLFADGFEG